MQQLETVVDMLKLSGHASMQRVAKWAVSDVSAAIMMSLKCCIAPTGCKELNLTLDLRKDVMEVLHGRWCLSTTASEPLFKPCLLG